MCANRNAVPHASHRCSALISPRRPGHGPRARSDGFGRQDIGARRSRAAGVRAVASTPAHSPRFPGSRRRSSSHMAKQRTCSGTYPIRAPGRHAQTASGSRGRDVSQAGRTAHGEPDPGAGPAAIRPSGRKRARPDRCLGSFAQDVFVWHRLAPSAGVSHSGTGERSKAAIMARNACNRPAIRKRRRHRLGALIRHDTRPHRASR